MSIYNIVIIRIGGTKKKGFFYVWELEIIYNVPWKSFQNLPTRLNWRDPTNSGGGGDLLEFVYFGSSLFYLFLFFFFSSEWPRAVSPHCQCRESRAHLQHNNIIILDVCNVEKKMIYIRQPPREFQNKTIHPNWFIYIYI